MGNADQSNTPNTRADAASDIPPHRYTAAFADEIETRWQETWRREQTFRVPNPGEPTFDGRKPKFFCLDMFPYPSGAGLHVGHPEGYTATDIICRYKRMCGFNVLHPMGWDAFGLPAEQYAIQTGVHPAITTRKAIDNFRRQLQRFGFCYDWSREFATIDPAYYRWTQWIFLQIYNSWYDTEQDRARPISELIEDLEQGRYGVNLFGEPVGLSAAAGLVPPITGEAVGVRRWHELTAVEKRTFIDEQRLAYVGEQVVNWCPKLGTALANEEVIDGRSERGGFPVLRKPLKQWMFRITAYAERLLKDLSLVQWPDSTRAQQTEWIGRSEGAEIEFPLADEDGAAGIAEYRSIRVYTTRPDTIFGSTYMVIAPEHPLVDRILSKRPHAPETGPLKAYVHAAKNRSDVDRQADSGGPDRAKTGVFSGVNAVNPATGENIPVWVADYVLMGYGHGAIMAVPAHDERDFDFARAFNLPIRDVVYSRPIAAMAYFAWHARADEKTPGRWAAVLAEFLGTVTRSNSNPHAFAQVLDQVRARRAAEGGSDAAAPADVIRVDLATIASDLPASVTARRGKKSSTWLDVLEAMDLKSFEDLDRAFGHGGFCAAIGKATPDPGFAANSRCDTLSLDGLPTEQAKQAAIEWIEREGLGNRAIKYKLRDWLFSRQRYWGEPFPIVWDEQGNHHPVDQAALPVTLPELADYQPEESDEPRPLLAKARDWVKTTAMGAGVATSILPPNTPVRRETNTMPGWAGSCWYYLRFCDPVNEAQFISEGAEQYWMGKGKDGGVDLYIGGSEHAVLHLLYARFWHKVLFDLGHVSTPEPFHKLFHQGLITAYSYQRPDKSLVPTDQVEEASEGEYVERATGRPLVQVVAKMSKSLKNVVNPDDVIAEYGADTFRLYEMYMGPLEASKPWNTRDIVGPFRFLQRVWRNLIDESTGRSTVVMAPAEPATLVLMHRTIAGVRKDIEGLSLNTAIAKLIEFNNHLTTIAAKGGVPREAAETLALLLAPFAPHIACELWAKMGHADVLADRAFPEPDPALMVEQTIEIPVQIQGKVRGHVTVPPDADAKAIETAALAEPKVQEWLAGKTVQKVIVVPGRMVNIVAK